MHSSWTTLKQFLLSFLLSSCWVNQKCLLTVPPWYALILFEANKSWLRMFKWRMTVPHEKEDDGSTPLSLYSAIQLATSESCACLVWLATLPPPSVSICWVGHLTCGGGLMGSKWLKMHQAALARHRFGWPQTSLGSGGIFLFPSSMSPRDLILLTWSHISDINLLTYFQICYCKDNIDILEDPWFALEETCEAYHVRDNLRGRKLPGRQC